MVTRKPIKAKKDGWIYVVHWSGSPHMVKIGFSSSLKERFNQFLTASHEDLIVIKVFEGDMESEKDLHERFAAGRRVGEWFALVPSLRNFLETEAPCQTNEARVKFASSLDGRVKWRPMTIDSRVLLGAMQQEKRIPRYVKNARSFVLWAINDIDGTGFYCTSNAIIHHDANGGAFQAKTIYNTLALLTEEGMVIKGANKCFRLTDQGELELEDMEEEYAERKRKSVRSLRIG